MDVLENILEKYFELYSVQNWNKKMRRNMKAKTIIFLNLFGYKEEKINF